MAGRYTIQRSTTVDATPEEVLAHVADLRAWQAWSPWEGVDPELSRTYTGPDSGVGATYEWSGNRQAGAGRMEVVEAVAGERVRVDLRFTKPFKATNDVVFTAAPSPSGGSEVTWTMHGDDTLVFRIVDRLTGVKKGLGGDFETGLSRLKAAAEAG